MADTVGPGTRAELARVLAAAMAGEDDLWAEGAPAVLGLSRLLDAGHADLVVRGARFHKAAHQLLLAAPALLAASPAAHDGLQAVRAETVLAEIRSLADLAVLRPALDDACPGWVLVKGLSLAHRVYDDPVARPVGDLDVVVAPRQFASAVRALEAVGGAVADSDWDLQLRELRGQVHVVMPHGTLVDLHWHLVNRHLVRQQVGPATSAVLARAVPVVVGEVLVRTLEPVDTVAHLALHAALSGGHRLGWLLDVRQALTVLRPDEAELADRARDWRSRAATGAILQRAGRVLRSPDALTAGAAVVTRRDILGRLLAAVERTDPVGGRVEDDGPVAWTTPTARDRGPVLSPRLRRRLAVPHRAPRSPSGPDARERYLTAVTAVAHRY